MLPARCERCVAADETSLAPTLLLAVSARAMSAKADLRYVSKPASDAAGQAIEPGQVP